MTPETTFAPTVITTPTVHVVGRQVVDAQAVQQFLDEHETFWETDTEVPSQRLAELAGRMCYMSFGTAQGRKTNGDYLGNLIEMQHGSVLEHAVWNLVFTGVSRSLTHELIRHRAGFGYSQLSQRYVDESTADFVMPHEIQGDPELEQAWTKVITDAHAAYVGLVEKLNARISREHPDLPVRDKRKMARQAARSVLPNATETKIFVTANARALRHFVELRGSAHAESEIRKLSVAVLRVMQQEAPNLFGDYRIVLLPDGTEGVETAHRKV